MGLEPLKLDRLDTCGNLCSNFRLNMQRSGSFPRSYLVTRRHRRLRRPSSSQSQRRMLLFTRG